MGDEVVQETAFDAQERGRRGGILWGVLYPGSGGARPVHRGGGQQEARLTRTRWGAEGASLRASGSAWHSPAQGTAGARPARFEVHPARPSRIRALSGRVAESLSDSQAGLQESSRLCLQLA